MGQSNRPHVPRLRRPAFVTVRENIRSSHGTVPAPSYPEHEPCRTSTVGLSPVMMIGLGARVRLAEGQKVATPLGMESARG